VGQPSMTSASAAMVLRSPSRLVQDNGMKRP